MTNQTMIFTAVAEDAVGITGDVNAFVTAGIAAGHINFDIKHVTTETRFDGAGTATKQIFFIVQVNYYNPAIA